LPNNFLILVLAVAVLLFLKEFIQHRHSRPQNRPAPARQCAYISRSSLLNSTERQLWAKLCRAAGKEYAVFCKVRLADVVGPPSGLTPSEAEGPPQQIDSLALDFVLCRGRNLSIAAAICLRDTGMDPSAEDRQTAVVQATLAAAEIPLLVLSATTEHGEDRLREELLRATGTAVSPADPKQRPHEERTQLIPTPADGEKQKTPCPVGAEPAVALPAQREAPDLRGGSQGACPSCGAAMVKRRISGGRLDGKVVLACPNFPGCKQILPLAAGSCEAV